MISKTSRPKHNETAGTATLSIRIQPRASKNEVILLENGGLKIRLTAPPVDNAANEALVKFLSAVLSVAKSQIEIVSGHTSREKIVRIHGVSEADAKRMLNSEGE
jgi:uncharacterized protein (TIGR00251 family)